MASPHDERNFGSFFLDDILDWCSDNLQPEDVFDTTALCSWAEDNDYIKADEEHS